jgi:hypothetical protein
MPAFPFSSVGSILEIRLHPKRGDSTAVLWKYQPGFPDHNNCHCDQRNVGVQSGLESPAVHRQIGLPGQSAKPSMLLQGPPAQAALVAGQRSANKTLRSFAYNDMGLKWVRGTDTYQANDIPSGTGQGEPCRAERPCIDKTLRRSRLLLIASPLMHLLATMGGSLPVLGCSSHALVFFPASFFFFFPDHSFQSPKDIRQSFLRIRCCYRCNGTPQGRFRAPRHPGLRAGD